MCEPTTAILVASTVVSTGIQVAGKIQEHGAQKKAQQENEASAKAALKEDLKTLTMREGQEEGAAASTILEIDRQARQTKAEAAVYAGESGVEGASVDALLDGFQNQADRASLGVQRNLKLTKDQLGRERVASQTGAQSRINAVPAPNPWATGLSIAGAGLGGAAQVVGALPRKGGGKP